MQESPPLVETSEPSGADTTEQADFGPPPLPPRPAWRRMRQLQAMLSMYTPYRELTRSLWHDSVEIDYRVKIPPAPIAEIDPAHMSRETLRRATKNFWEPAVVRGLFRGAPALEKWPTTEYLPSTPLGDRIIPVVMNARYGTNQDDREDTTFRDAFLDIVQNRAQKYLFFPVESRFQMKTGGDGRESELPLRDVVRQLVKQDLPLDRIWPGFGGPEHRHFLGAQVIVGYGQKTPETTTGTNWHCAVSNNFFIQVAGRKRWYFLSQKLSRYLYPIRNGTFSMMSGVESMARIQQHLPTSYVDLEPGDLLYNPYWMWHAVMNYEGLSIGVPLREVELRRAFGKNAHYTSVALVNKIALNTFNYDIGGYGDEFEKKQKSKSSENPAAV